MPFVQGHLRKEPLTISVESECAHCAQPIRFEVDSELNYRVEEKEADPLVFVPTVDFGELKEPSIVDVF
jgi:hypothetical protein